ncbi:MAG: hypothetical protein P8X66_10300 [Maritimibacter sp.]|jgi:vacuolar-type H+-ATPase subunit F/Vma7
MNEGVVFIGDHLNAVGFRNAGIHCYVPEASRLTERVLAERHRCRILAISEAAFHELPEYLARELCDSLHPQLAIVPDASTVLEDEDIREKIDLSLARARAYAETLPPEQLYA